MLMFLTTNDRAKLQDMGFVLGRVEDVQEGHVVLYVPIEHGRRPAPIVMRVRDLKIQGTVQEDEDGVLHGHKIYSFMGMGYNGVVYPVSLGYTHELYFLDEDIANFTKVGVILAETLEGALEGCR